MFRADEWDTFHTDNDDIKEALVHFGVARSDKFVQGPASWSKVSETSIVRVVVGAKEKEQSHWVVFDSRRREILNPLRDHRVSASRARSEIISRIGVEAKKEIEA